MTKDKPVTSLRGGAALSNIIVGVLLFATVLGFANYLSFRHFERWDITSTARFAVSARTRAVVRGLTKDVKIYLFLSERDPSYPEVRELLRKYESMSSRLTVSILDPDANPARYRVLVQRFGIRTAQQGDETFANVAAVVESGERVHKIESSDLMSLSESLADRENPTVDVQTERALTSGILAVTRGRNTRVCVTTGHGEWAREGGGERSLAEMSEGFLELDNIELEDLELTPTATIPRACDAVFVLGPQRVFEEAIASKLGAYVRAGGHLLVTVDPMLRDQSTLLPTGLEAMLSSFGIVVGTDVVVERSANHQLSDGGPIETIKVNGFGEHPITRLIAAMDGMLALHFSRSVGARQGSTAQVILRASPESYAETNLAVLQVDSEIAPGEGDLPGPVPLAVAWSSSEDLKDVRAGRIVVIGDTDLFRDELLHDPRLSNSDFLSAVAGFLTARPQLIEIAPRRTSVRTITATSGDAGSIYLRVVILIPLAFILLGLSVWWSRRA